ncbi:hypothetical protein GGI12_003375 [Dipsacomyces acuminosporus]|nr:hypothetical protein GGI12_003375 [Dipsacomyces acuminosporus]
MPRTVINIGVMILASVVVVSANAPGATDAYADPVSTAPAQECMRGLNLCGGGGGGGGGRCDDGKYGCHVHALNYEGPYGCCPHTCCCHKPPPSVSVHVIQPPPTYIYDITQTAYYTENQDCCGHPYVVGPTCIPQGEVLAPGNVGRRIAVKQNEPHHNHHHHHHHEDR